MGERRRRDDALRALLLKDPDTALGERLLGPELHTLLKVYARQPEVLL